MKLLTDLRVGVKRLDMHDVTDSSSNNNHLPTISLAHTNNATQAPVSEICIAFMWKEQQSIKYVTVSFITFCKKAITSLT